jgi:hypothetical protein
MGFPIVNTPRARNFVAARSPSLLQQSWNSAPPEDDRELPPYLGHYPEPWLGPLSFAVRHTPVVSPCKVETVGTSVAASRDEAPDRMSLFRWHHVRRRRTLLRRPAGFSFIVDDPKGRSHHPRAYTPPRQQCCGVKIDGPMQFAFAGPLRLPTPVVESLLLGDSGCSRASHLAAGRVSDTLMKRGSAATRRRSRQ